MRGERGHSGEDAAGRRAAGELEAAVLAVLQAAGSPLSPGEVRDRLGGELAYTTVVTILSFSPMRRKSATNIGRSRLPPTATDACAVFVAGLFTILAPMRCKM